MIAHHANTQATTAVSDSRLLYHALGVIIGPALPSICAGTALDNVDPTSIVAYELRQ
jgi:hypothetical protein